MMLWCTLWGSARLSEINLFNIRRDAKHLQSQPRSGYADLATHRHTLQVTLNAAVTIKRDREQLKEFSIELKIAIPEVAG
jgi:hypothetical protein